MLRLSLQYDIMDVEDIIGPGVTLVYRLCSARIVLSILIIILIIVQIFEFRPNKIIPVSIGSLSIVYCVFYLVATWKIHCVVSSSDLLVYERAACQMKEYVDGNVLVYFLFVGAFLVCRYFILRRKNINEKN